MQVEKGDVETNRCKLYTCMFLYYRGWLQTSWDHLEALQRSEEGPTAGVIAVTGYHFLPSKEEQVPYLSISLLRKVFQLGTIHKFSRECYENHKCKKDCVFDLEYSSIG